MHYIIYAEYDSEITYHVAPHDALRFTITNEKIQKIRSVFTTLYLGLSNCMYTLEICILAFSLSSCSLVV